MKTAMQELLEWAKNSDMSDTMISPQDLLNVINPLLEKEKEQMIDFAMQMHKIDYSKTGTDILLDEAKQYYDQTYNK